MIKWKSPTFICTNFGQIPDFRNSKNWWIAFVVATFGKLYLHTHIRVQWKSESDNYNKKKATARRLCCRINHNILLLFINTWHLNIQWYRNRATKARAKVNPKKNGNKLLKYKQFKSSSSYKCYSHLKRSSPKPPNILDPVYIPSAI